MIYCAFRSNKPLEKPLILCGKQLACVGCYKPMRSTSQSMGTIKQNATIIWTVQSRSAHEMTTVDMLFFWLIWTVMITRRERWLLPVDIKYSKNNELGNVRTTKSKSGIGGHISPFVHIQVNLYTNQKLINFDIVLVVQKYGYFYDVFEGLQAWRVHAGCSLWLIIFSEKFLIMGHVLVCIRLIYKALREKKT